MKGIDMGYIRHHGIFVTSFNEELLKSAHTKARKIFGNLASEIVESPVNGYYSFAVFPDGSKEGWNDSNRGDANREQFKSWLLDQLHEDLSSSIDWVEVQYGDDNHESVVVDDSDAPNRAIIVEAEEEVETEYRQVSFHGGLLPPAISG